MSLTFRSLACAVLLLGGAGVLQAQNPAACESVQFSEDILSRFPNAPEACLDVITRDGQKYAVFRAELQSVRGNTLRVRVKKPDGSRGELISVPTSSDFRVLIDGRPTPVRDVAPNQELTAYVHVTKPEVALAPAVQTQTLRVVPLTIVSPEEEQRLASSEDAPAMPATATSFGLLALVGQFLLALALALTLIRRRGK